MNSIPDESDTDALLRPGPNDMHCCMLCGKDASFGFWTERRGVVWTCFKPRAEGQAVVVPPLPMQRVA